MGVLATVLLVGCPPWAPSSLLRSAPDLGTGAGLQPLAAGLARATVPPSEFPGTPFDAPTYGISHPTSATGYRASGPSGYGGALENASPPPHVVSVRPAAGGVTLTGQIFDSVRGTPVVDASVTATSIYGVCTVCSSGSTDSSGKFSVTAAPGATTVAFSAQDYVPNATWVTVPTAGSLALGSLDLVHVAWITGTFAGHLPTRPPIGNATVTTLPRSPSTLSFSNSTKPDGSFRVDAVPAPSELELFVPGGVPFFSNWTYVNATPWSTLDLGTIFAEGGIGLSATFVDRATGLPIAGTIPTLLRACPELVGSCESGPRGFGGTNVSGWTEAGPLHVQALAQGYVVNTTWVPDVALGATGVDLGRIDLVPAGALELSSNFTGGVPSPTGWAAGTSVGVGVCSLDGLQVAEPDGATLEGYPCLGANTVGLGAAFIALAPPLRDVLVVVPSTNFPYELASITGLPSGYPDLEANISWANVTPDRLLQVGSVDLTPGTFLAGNVTVDGVAPTVNGTFTVQVCSVLETSICTVATDAALYAGAFAGCPTRVDSYCVAAPPGPDLLRFTSVATGNLSAGSNRTWFQVPFGCCAQDGHPTWLPLTDISGNPAGGAVVTGRVALQLPGGGPPVAPGALVIRLTDCPVGPVPLGAPTTCSTFYVSGNGSFAIPSFVGWRALTAAGAAFAENGTWVDATGTNSTGTIVLEPDALLAGRVVTPDGTGVPIASISVCPASEPTLCGRGPIGASGTDGRFNVTVPGAAFPGGAEMVEITAPGYAANWTWGNASAGAVTDLGSIVAAPIGAAHPARVASTPAALGASWITGRTLDARSGAPIGDSSITVCPLPSGPCVAPADPSPPDGAFNFSLAPGRYALTASAPEFTATTVSVNATGAAYDVGSVAIMPMPRVAGRLALDPWEGLTESQGLGAAGAQLSGCDPTLTTCGPLGSAASDGSFNVSIPFGSGQSLRADGDGPGIFGSAPGGYSPRSFDVDVSSSFITIAPADPADLSLPIYGEVRGSARDGTSWNATRHAATQPAGFAEISANDNGSAPSDAQTITGGGGDYLLEMPNDGGATNVVGRGSAYLTDNVTLHGTIGTATVRPGIDLPLPRYGYVQVRVLDAGSLVPLAGALVSTAVADPANGSWIYTSGTTNGIGYANVTAPPNPLVSVTVAASGYVNVTRAVSVTTARATGLGNISLAENPVPDVAWFRSLEVASYGRPLVVGAIDALTGSAIAGASLVATTPTGATGAPATSNGLGQFLVAAPPGVPDALSIAAVGYELLTTYANSPAGAVHTYTRVNLTGLGIVAGRIVVAPGGGPGIDLEVEACPLSGGSCTFAFTNGDGAFWIDAAPGTDALSIQTDLYDANTTTIVTVSADGFSEIGALTVYALATVLGTVRGLPDGAPIDGATASLCVRLQFPYGPCDLSTTTDSSGQFVLPAPPGTYVLAVTAPAFNTTATPLAVAPGATVDAGTIFLLAWGGVEGTVVAQITGAPIAGAQVQVCAAWTTGDCSVDATTNASGGYLLQAPPGPATVVAAADGYYDGTTAVAVASGGLVVAPEIFLVAEPPAYPFTVNGTVEGPDLATGTGSGPLGGAFVGLARTGVTIVATATAPDGSYSLAATEGTYALEVRVPGYQAVATLLQLDRNLTGQVVTLSIFRYALTGTAYDRSTGLPVGGIAIAEGSTVLTISHSDGTFSAPLANGSYTLLAAPANGTAYEPLTFEATINGADLGRDLQLTATGLRLNGSVVDLVTGLPVPLASVSVSAGPNATSSYLATTSATSLGAFSFLLGPGVYRISASAPGYANGSVVADLSAGNGSFVLGLVPTSTGGAATGSPPLLAVVLLAGIGVVGVGVAVALSRYRRPRRIVPEPDAPAEDDEPPCDAKPDGAEEI